MSTWTCQCGEMNAATMPRCRCGMSPPSGWIAKGERRCGVCGTVYPEDQPTCPECHKRRSQSSGKTGELANHSESPKSSRKAITPEERLNKTERAFLEYLRHRWCDIGIQSITLRLAWGVRYTPDFWTKSNDTLHFWEVKGFMRDDARKSLMFAAKEYPWAIFWLVKRDKSQPSGWSITEVRR